MSLQLITIVLPDGTTEYRTSVRLLPGDLVKHRGEDLVVDRITEDEAGSTVVTLLKPATPS